MSESASAETSEPVTHEEDTASEDDTDSDSDTDYDPKEIEKEIMGVRSMLRRHCGRHKVKTEKVQWNLVNMTTDEAIKNTFG